MKHLAFTGPWGRIENSCPSTLRLSPPTWKWVECPTYPHQKGGGVDLTNDSQTWGITQQQLIELHQW